MPHRSQAHVALDIDAGGTGDLSRTETVRVMIRKEQFKRGLARIDNTGISRRNVHALCDARNAGRNKPVPAFYFHNAQET